MIRRLQIKIIAITMGVLLLVFAAVLLTLNIFMQASSVRQTEFLLNMVVEADGLYQTGVVIQGGQQWVGRQWTWQEADGHTQGGPPDMPEIMRAGRFFYVKLDGEGNALEARIDRMVDVTGEDAVDYAQDVVFKGRTGGTIDNLQYMVAEKEYGFIAAFAERSIETQMLGQLTRTSLYVAGASALVLFVPVFFFSRWAVRPVRDAFEKQKRFISDASHELKTPLTIISANADVLENEAGPSERLDQIKMQSMRMELLIRDLLTLARSDEDVQTVMAPFDLSSAVRNTTLEFESRVFEADKTLTYEIQDDLQLTGDEAQIRRLAAILIDNAIVHSAPGGQVRVCLSADGGKKRLSVYNTGAGIPEENRDRVFDRFYRSDDSRSRRTGGYGLGLSIAKSIADLHKSRIMITGEADAWVEFTVMFS